MPFRLELPKRLRERGWKVKIQDKERLEPPHVTVWHGEDVWRICLRTGSFLIPPGGSWKDVDDDVRTLIADTWGVLIHEWDARYPENPVSRREEDDDA
jgi:hypothetical protein